MKNFKEFSEAYKPKKNTLSVCSPLDNSLFELSEEEMEVIEETSEDKVWTLYDNGTIKNGRFYNRKNIFGYVICNTPWTEERGKMKITLI